jgi:uncharacterized membrane protein
MMDLALMRNPFVAVLMAAAASLVPGLELRVGIPTGVALGLPMGLAITAATLGNCLQIPIAMLVVDWLYQHSERIPVLHRWLVRTEAGVQRHRTLIRRFGWIGLAIFVILPLPTTGVWGGVVLARIFNMDRIPILAGVGLGIILSGLVWGLGFQGGFSLFDLV